MNAKMGEVSKVACVVPLKVIDWIATTMSRSTSPANVKVAAFGENLDVS